MKSFLAGKRGVCPKCGVSLRIPMESQLDHPSAAADADEPEPEGEPEDLVGDAFASIGIETATRTKATRSNGSAAVESPTEAPARGPAASPFSETSVEAARIAIAAPAGADPIAEAPEAIWYVRPPSGGQYGPARGDIMSRWLAEGRVSSDSLVWREGWTDWQSASQVFSSLRSSSTASAGPIPPTPPPPAVPKVAAEKQAAEKSAAASAGTTPSRTSRVINRYEAQRKQGSSLGIVAVIALGLLCLVLAALLVYFVGGFHNGGTPNESPTKAAAE